MRENIFYTDRGYFRSAHSLQQQQQKKRAHMNLEQMRQRRIKRVVNDLTLMREKVEKRVREKSRGIEFTWRILISA